LIRRKDQLGQRGKAADFGYAGSAQPSAYPRAGVDLTECGTHAFLAAEVAGSM